MGINKRIHLFSGLLETAETSPYVPFLDIKPPGFVPGEVHISNFMEAEKN